MISGREHRKHEIHYADVGANSGNDDIFELILLYPINKYVAPIRLDCTDKSIDAILANKRNPLRLFQPSKLLHKVFLTGSDLAVRRVGRFWHPDRDVKICDLAFEICNREID